MSKTAACVLYFATGIAAVAATSYLSVTVGLLLNLVLVTLGVLLLTGKQRG